MSWEVICFALGRKGVPEYLVNGVISLYKECKTAVSVDGELSSSFSVKVGVHQGSALSPLLFIMVMDVLADVRDGSLMELLYAHGLVLCGESLKVDPCGVCGERVGCNSTQCTKCQRWIYRRSSDVPRQVSLHGIM